MLCARLQEVSFYKEIKAQCANNYTKLSYYSPEGNFHLSLFSRTVRIIPRERSLRTELQSVINYV